MRIAALISGGKDSTFNMMQCIAAGHEIVALANLYPYNMQELDSYMYQSVGYEAVDYIAAAMDLPLYKKATKGQSVERQKNYTPTENDEVEDLYVLLQQIKDEMGIDGVSVGAILSDYQRIRVENVCIRLDLIPLAYLWQKEQKELLNEMIQCEVDAIIIKVAALGLDPHKHLGRTLSSLQPHLHSMHEQYGLNVCGEGGEYETLTLDCPLFKSTIIIEDSEIVLLADDPIAPVGYLKLNELSLANKLPPLDLKGRLACLPLKDSDGYVTDYGEEALEFEETENNTNLTMEENRNLLKQKPIAARSTDGWLWIGGITGDSPEPAVAMAEALDKLKSILTEYDQQIQDVCLVTMFISSMDQYVDLNRIYCQTFVHMNPPSRACVEVALDQNCPIIIQALSWANPMNPSGDNPIERHTMHVQSRSHWAPANIGPYSQSVRVGEIIFLAGQIGLVPGSLEMVNGGIKAQCQLALRHVGRLLKAVDNNINLRDVVQGICYVTDLSFVECARKIWEEKTNNAIVDYVVVTQLPKKALIEWHVWAHKHNNQFEYEETGKCIGNYSISIYRRWNYENNLAAIVCRVDNPDDLEFDSIIFNETVKYTVKKLQQGHENDTNSLCNLTIFYSSIKQINVETFLNYLEDISASISLVYTIVPVLHLKRQNTYLSICGIRNQ